jgi:hypothetical protein
LSARITKRQYLTEIVMTSAHKISERTPIAASGGKLSADSLDDRLQGVERARPEIAADDAERGECCCGRRSPSDAGWRGALFSGCDDRHPFHPPWRRSAFAREADRANAAHGEPDKTEIARSQHAHRTVVPRRAAVPRLLPEGLSGTHDASPIAPVDLVVLA